ncbi:Aste57867_12792 [Aphanomyces stellatus]|uniref:Aste57867_12792 protein n=1 Tax=Aphanomyces stellatus TaxID=120398 RepID=A0A485KWJ6_9STRA|nr:hypothetical protein As57867_012744 [Aphanomyces stellatus]VFT89641.1 Aste57867_12792 [Aphanomyces stellatus]
MVTTPPTSTSTSDNNRATNTRYAILRLVTLNILAPLVIYSLLSSHMSDVSALLLSGIPPALDTFAYIYRERRVDIISGLSVTSIVLGAVVAAITNDARVLLVKDSLFTIGFGVAFFVSITCAKEDLIWTYNRTFRGPDAKDDLDAKYQLPHVRSSSHFLCKVWGTGLLMEAVVRIVLIYSIPVSSMVYVSPCLLVSTFLLLGYWTKAYVTATRQTSTEAIDNNLEQV